MQPDKDQGADAGEAESAASRKESGSPQPDQLQNLREQLYELKERILALRDGELHELKEKLLQLSTRIITALTVVGAIVVAAGFWGFHEYSDLKSLATTALAERLDKNVGYYEKELKAIFQVRSLNNCAAAIPTLRELHLLRPDDEVPFYLLLHCLAEQGAFDVGYELIQKAKQNYDFYGTYKLVLTWNNAGAIMLGKGLDEPKLIPEAVSMLEQAQRVGQNDPDLWRVLGNLMCCYVLIGDMNHARACASQWREIVGKQWEPPISDPSWLYKFERIRPSARSDFAALSALTAPNSSPQPQLQN